MILIIWLSGIVNYDMLLSLFVALDISRIGQREFLLCYKYSPRGIIWHVIGDSPEDV